MTSHDPSTAPGRFGYFSVRVHWTGPEGGEAVRCVVERLGRGEKFEFASPAELARFIFLAPASDARGSDA